MNELNIPTTAEQKALDNALKAFGGDTERLALAISKLSSSTVATKRKMPNDISSTPVIVQLDSINRRYKMGKNIVGAVNDISLTIHEGEFVAITGASGSGKSTLLNLIGGLDRPDSGTINVAGCDLAKLSDVKLSEYRNKTIGFVFQFFYLQPFLNVATNLEVPAMFGSIPRQLRRERIATLAAAVGLTDRLEHLPRELSGGQMQRAAIARALVNQPKILLADEPTGNLDSANSRGIMELFTKVRDEFGATIIVVTHDENIANVADRTIAMHDGRVV